MLISFANRIRQRPSGTGNNEPPTSPRNLAPRSQAATSELSRQSTPHFPHAGLKEETAT